MKVTGIIAEFNPLHNGHEYFLNKAVRDTCADYSVAVISGDFTQRGTPAICDKHLRALMALRSGVDLVIELPVFASTSSAEFYASSGVFLLESLGVVTDICFGSEYGDIEALGAIADILLEEPEEFKECLKEELKKGHSFPTARANALLNVLPAIHDLQRIMSFPNDILAVEYLKALKKSGSGITPHPVVRLGAGYHDNRIGIVNSSALAVRNSIKETGDLDNIRSEIPESSYLILSEYFNKTLPIFTEDFSEMLRYSLLRASYNGTDLTDFSDVSKNLASRIRKNISRYRDFESFISLIKTRDMTYTRICRALLHILLEIRSPEKNLDESNSYARILGFKGSAAPLIKEINSRSKIPVISRLSDAPRILSPEAQNTLNNDLFASDLYYSIIEKKFGSPVQKDLKRRLINSDGIFISGPADG